MDLSGFNIWEVLVAAILPFAIGFLWYGKPLFANTWQKLAGLSDEDIASSNMGLIFGLSFVAQFIIAAFLSFLVEIFMMIGSNALLGGLFAALVCLAFVATTFATNYLFARKPLKLYLIDVGYHFVTFFAMGVLIGAWH